MGRDSGLEPILRGSLNPETHVAVAAVRPKPRETQASSPSREGGRAILTNNNRVPPMQSVFASSRDSLDRVQPACTNSEQTDGEKQCQAKIHQRTAMQYVSPISISLACLWQCLEMGGSFFGKRIYRFVRRIDIWLRLWEFSKRLATVLIVYETTIRWHSMPPC